LPLTTIGRGVTEPDRKSNCSHMSLVSKPRF